MCDFCVQHGQGKKWYLEAKNYSQDLLSDTRRRRFIADFFTHPEHLERDSKQLARLQQTPPFVRRAVSAAITRRMKKQHFGQVVPLEDVEPLHLPGDAAGARGRLLLCRLHGPGRQLLR